MTETIVLSPTDCKQSNVQSFHEENKCCCFSNKHVQVFLPFFFLIRVQKIGLVTIKIMHLGLVSFVKLLFFLCQSPLLNPYPLQIFTPLHLSLFLLEFFFSVLVMFFSLK